MSLKLGQTCEAVKTVIVRVHSNNRNQPFSPKNFTPYHKVSDHGSIDDTQKQIIFLQGVEALQRARQFRQEQLFTEHPTGANNIEYQMLATYYRQCLKFWKKPTLKPGFPLLVSTEWAFNKAKQRQKAKSRRARTRQKLFGICYQVKEVIPF